MICRLCLNDLDGLASIFIFGDVELDLPKTIAKYLHLEVTLNDNVSTQLCTACWRYLTEFEQFCIMVTEKQMTLQLKMEPEPPPEPAVVVWNTESPIESKLGFDDDIKDHILCEPEIDVQDSTLALDNNSYNRSNSSYENDTFADDFHDMPLAHVILKATRGRTRQTVASKVNKCSKPPVGSLRESRARTREQRRNAAAVAAVAAAVPVAAADAPKPTVSVTKTKKVKTKRGRPKGSVAAVAQAPRPKSDASELEAKRSSIKEMDEYIATNVKMDCCLCAAPLQDFIDLKRHFRAVHNCTGYMECCNNRYKKRTLYVDHLHYHKDPFYFSCKPCGKRFLNRNSQDMHMLRFHSDQQQLVHQCVICDARFAKKFLLTMHIKCHKGTERPEVCDHCNKTFRTKLELTAHIKRMHTDDFPPVICDICGVNFRSKANFLIHKKALHPEGPVAEVQCHLCNRWLRDERSLRKHLARHDDRDSNSKYRCPLCGAEKASRVALSSHMRYHHSTKRHSCTLCSKEFKLPRALMEHMATHTGIDLYSCPFCTRTFKSHANMHNHKKKMHPNEWVRKYTQPSAAGGSNAANAVSLATEDPEAVKDPSTKTAQTPTAIIENGAEQIDADAVDYEFLGNNANCPL